MKSFETKSTEEFAKFFLAKCVGLRRLKLTGTQRWFQWVPENTMAITDLTIASNGMSYETSKEDCEIAPLVSTMERLEIHQWWHSLQRDGTIWSRLRSLTLVNIAWPGFCPLDALEAPALVELYILYQLRTNTHLDLFEWEESKRLLVDCLSRQAFDLETWSILTPSFEFVLDRPSRRMTVRNMTEQMVSDMLSAPVVSRMTKHCDMEHWLIVCDRTHWYDDIWRALEHLHRPLRIESDADNPCPWKDVQHITIHDTSRYRSLYRCMLNGLLRPRDWQCHLMRQLNDEKAAVINLHAPRRAGKTELNAVLACWHAAASGPVTIVTHNGDHVRSVIARYRCARERFPIFVVPADNLKATHKGLVIIDECSPLDGTNVQIGTWLQQLASETASRVVRFSTRVRNDDGDSNCLCWACNINKR
jgi:hypothetical protein